MKTVSFINLKGGVGKTTVATNLAYALAESWGLHVLFIDNDKQGNASSWFNADPNKGTLTNIFLDGVTADEVIQHTRYPNIDLIASDMGLIDANFSVIKNESVKQDDILKRALREASNRYDICIVDNPPDINMSVFNSLVITDDVVIVTFPEFDSLAGVYKMADAIEQAKMFNPSIRIRGVLFNEFMSTSDIYGYVDEMEKKFPVFSSHIRYATRVAKDHMNVARSKKLSLFEEYPNCGVSRDLLKFAEELMGE